MTSWPASDEKSSPVARTLSLEELYHTQPVQPYRAHHGNARRILDMPGPLIVGHCIRR